MCLKWKHYKILPHLFHSVILGLFWWTYDSNPRGRRQVWENLKEEIRPTIALLHRMWQLLPEISVDHLKVQAKHSGLNTRVLPTHTHTFNSPSLLKTCTSNVCYSRCRNLLQEVKVKNRSVWGASTGTKVRECPRKCKTCAPEQRLSVWIYLQPNRTGTGYAPSKNNQTSPLINT